MSLFNDPLDRRRPIIYRSLRPMAPVTLLRGPVKFDPNHTGEPYPSCPDCGYRMERDEIGRDGRCFECEVAA